MEIKQYVRAYEWLEHQSMPPAMYYLISCLTLLAQFLPHMMRENFFWK